MTPPGKTALVTGGSRGLGLALTAELVRRRWRVVVDARDGARLEAAIASLPHPEQVVAVPGDVVDAAHRAELAAVVERLGGLDLLVSNASVLGRGPLPPLAEHPLPELLEVFQVNCLAPLALLQLLLPALRRSSGRVVHVSSDAAVEAYEGWGAYGAAKAALDHATRVLALEEPGVRLWSFDPGEMDTELHRSAEPAADLSGLPQPAEVVPSLLRLLDEDLPTGRWTAGQLALEVAR